MIPASSLPRSGATVRESIAITAGLLVIIAVQLVASDSSYLLRKYFWTDELCTYTLLSDANVGHAVRALRGSVDINPPGLHILLFGFTRLVHSTSEVALRSFALLAMVMALTGIYVVVREFVGKLAAMTAVLAVWSHPLILDHAFEVRYYGPWLAAAVWFCWLLGRVRTQPRNVFGAVGLAIASFFLCTIHYLGVVTLMIVVAAEWLWHRDRPLPAPWGLAAIAVGPLATVAAVLLLLPYQRAATTVSTWIPNPSVAGVVDFGMTLFLPLHLGAVVMIAWFSTLTANGVEPHKEGVIRQPVPFAPIGLTSLALLVPALVAFSYLVQSVLISRYGLPAIAALAPAVAFAAAQVSKPWKLVLIAFLIASSAFQLRQRSVRALVSDGERQQLIQDIRERTGQAPVIFEAPHQLNVVWHYAPDLRDRVFLLDFEKGQLGDQVSTFRIWSRDLAKQFVKFYDGPALLPWTDVQREPSIYIVPHPQAYTEEPAADARYAQFRMTPVHGQLQQLSRSDAR
jgi:hypothetical protein